MEFQKKNQEQPFTDEQTGEDAANQENGQKTGRKRKKFQAGKAGRAAIGILVALAAVYLVGGSVYTLKENEYAVVTTFGVPSIIGEPGIHVRIPLIQQMARVPKTINGFSIGYDKDTDVSVDSE